MTANHETLADALIALVESEHEALRSFDLDRYTTLAEERAALCHEVIALAKTVPIPAAQAEQYRWAQACAEENYTLLQDAQQVVGGIIKRLTGNPAKSSTYNKAGARASYQSPGGNGVMVWKG